MNSHDKRLAERSKYRFAYTHSKYRMKKERGAFAVSQLQALAPRGSYLDVSCGRGEMLVAAFQLGFRKVQGTEIVPELIDGNRVIEAWAHKLPFSDNAYEVVSFYDVIEHLHPGDDELACRELGRVAKCHVLLTANNKPSFNKRGDDLHINKRPYEEWDALLRQWFAPYTVTWLQVQPGEQPRVSEFWRVDCESQ